MKRGIPVNVSIADGAGTLLSQRGEQAEKAAPVSAASPEDLVRLFAERANAGDVEGLVDLYETEATLAAGERLSRGRTANPAILRQPARTEEGIHTGRCRAETRRQRSRRYDRAGTGWRALP